MGQTGRRYMKATEIFKLLVGGIVTAFSAFLGGLDGVIYTLIGFMSIDYITGVMSAAKCKRLSSEVGFWGLVKKVCMIALVGIANLVDVSVIGSGNALRTCVVLYLIGNEGLSLLENMTRLGVPFPKKLIDMLAQLKNDNE